MTAQKSFKDLVEKLMQDIHQKNKDKIIKVSSLISKMLDEEGILFTFGTGHSTIFVEETFHRAGGLIPVYPILYSFLSPHITPKIAARLERQEGLASILYDKSNISSKDILWVASNSGINSTSVEMALEAKKNGVLVIATTSYEHSSKVDSRHSSKKKLYEIADIYFDNCCPEGDALASFSDTRACAGSTMANSYIYQSVLFEVCSRLFKSGKEIPVYRSSNSKGGDEYNQRLEKKYRLRIPQIG